MSRFHGPIFMLGVLVSCKEVNKLLASGLELTFVQRIKLWCHLRICYTCKRFAEHLKIISKSFRNVCEQVEPAEVKELEQSVLKEIAKRK